MNYVWHPFDPTKGSDQLMPPERRYVLVQLPEKKEIGYPPSVAVGYLKYSGGEKEHPFFIIPGIGGYPTHWCDCLGDEFNAPLWPSAQEKIEAVKG